MNEEELGNKASQIFLKAAEYIRKYGWQVSGMSKNGKARCSMGALASANPEKKWDKSLAELMYGRLYKELSGLSLTQFNYKYQDGEKVAQLFEQTAVSLTASTPHIVQK
jgi:translation elongation factor EF-Ts